MTAPLDHPRSTDVSLYVSLLSMVPEDFHQGYLPVSIPFNFFFFLCRVKVATTEFSLVLFFFFFLVDLLLTLVSFFFFFF